MKRICFIIGIILSLVTQAQYNPSLHTVTNKALGIAQDVPTDARSQFYDTVKKVYRPFQSTSEVLGYLNTTKWRTGLFPIFVNEGGTLSTSTGKITGGFNKEYWFQNGVANSDLVLKAETTSGTVAQLRAMSTSTGKAYTSTDRGGGTWVDEGLNDGGAVDDGAIYIITANGHRLHRQITGDVYVTWFGAIPNDTNSDLAAFNAAVAFCKTLKGTPRLHIPGGRYRLNGRWIVDGFAWTDGNGYSTWTGIKIVGDGSQSTILDFAASTTGGLQYGSGATNTLNAGIEGVDIIGNQNIDGLTIVSTSPYVTHDCTFSDLLLNDVRKGITDSTGISFTASNHDNHFISPKVERYWKYGIEVGGVYNDFTGTPFVVHPMGSGANTLALNIQNSAQSNTFDNFTCEDQVAIRGYENKLPNLRIEKVIKTVGYSGFFGQVIQIDGINNMISGKVNDVDNSLINSIVYVTGANIKISDFQYRNEESDPNHVIQNPAILENVSSGVMDNVVFNTTNKMDKEGYYEKAMLKWAMTNVEGENGAFSKAANEIRVETPPSGIWPAGIKAINKTPLSGEPLYWIRNISGTDSSWVSSINSLDQIAATGNATSRVLISNAGMYAPDHHLNGNSANNIGGYFTTLGTSAVMQATNFAGNGGAVLVLNKSGGKVGIGKDPGVDSLDVEGTGKFSGNITTIDAVDSLHTPTYRQLVRNINSIPIQWGVVGSDIRNTTGTRVDVTGLTFSTNDAFFVDNTKAVMMKSASHGMLLKGATGSQNDYAVATPAGQLIIYNPTGSNNLIIGNLNGTVTVPTTVSASRANQPTQLVQKQYVDSFFTNTEVDSVNLKHWGDATGHTVTGTTAETTVYSRTVKANTLGPNGYMELKYFVKMDSTTIVSVYFGGVQIVKATIFSNFPYQCVSNYSNTGSQVTGFSPWPDYNYMASGSMAFTKTYEINTSVDQPLVVTLTNATTGKTSTLSTFQAFFYQ